MTQAGDEKIAQETIQAMNIAAFSEEIRRLRKNLHSLRNGMQSLSLAMVELKVKMSFMMKFVTITGSLVVGVLIGLLVWFFTTGVKMK